MSVSARRRNSAACSSEKGRESTRLQEVSTIRVDDDKARTLPAVCAGRQRSRRNSCPPSIGVPQLALSLAWSEFTVGARLPKGFPIICWNYLAHARGGTPRRRATGRFCWMVFVKMFSVANIDPQAVDLLRTAWSRADINPLTC